MIRRNLRITAAISLALLIAFGSTAFAATNEPSVKIEKKSNDSDGTCKHCHEHHKGGWFLTPDVLNQLGISKDDISKAKEEKKTIFDLAKEKKGFTPEQVRALILACKTEEINKRVSEGKLTKEKAENKISKIKEKLNNWDGSLNKD